MMLFDEQEIARIISEDQRIEAAYLLGSAAANSMRADSDIDIAILPVHDAHFDGIAQLDLGARLSFNASREVDVGVISSHNLVYAKEAILAGRRIFQRDCSLTDVRETTLLGMFLVFNEDRREVLNAYTA